MMVICMSLIDVSSPCIVEFTVTTTDMNARCRRSLSTAHQLLLNPEMTWLVRGCKQNARNVGSSSRSPPTCPPEIPTSLPIAHPSMPDIEGIFEDSLLALFDHRPIAFSTPGPAEPYAYAPSPIRFLDGAPVDLPQSKTYAQGPHVKVHLPVAPSGLHTTLQLTHIWLSSILLADLISHGAIPVQGALICELGAGAGLPGIVAARSGAEAVVSTDYAVPSLEEEAGEGKVDVTDVLGVLRGNFRRAMPNVQEGSLWRVLGHTWGEPVTEILTSCTSHAPTAPPKPLAQRFATILCADLLWTTSAHSALITSLLALLDPRQGVAHIVAGLHQGRGAVERFRSAWVTRTGGWIADVLEVQWGMDGWEVLRDLREETEVGRGEQEEGDEHGTVVYFRIGLRDDP